MSEKKFLKLSLTKLLVFFEIILIIVLMFCLSMMYKQKENAIEEIMVLKKQISKLEHDIKTMNTESSEINNELNENEEIQYQEITNELDGIDVLYVTNAIENDDDTYTLKGVIYTQYTFNINELTVAVKEGKININDEEYIIKYDLQNNAYRLYNDDNEESIYVICELTPEVYYLEVAATITDCLKLTNDYRQITISKDLKVISEWTENQTVEDVFKNYEEKEIIETTHPLSDASYFFEFENGKCVKIINRVTSM